MSGGSYDYAFGKLEDFASSLRHTEKDPRRVVFKELLCLVVLAMRDIEWVDSGDYSPGEENDSIDAVMAFLKSDPKTIIKARAYDRLAEKLESYMELAE